MKRKTQCMSLHFVDRALDRRRRVLVTKYWHFEDSFPFLFLPFKFPYFSLDDCSHVFSSAGGVRGAEAFHVSFGFVSSPVISVGVPCLIFICFNLLCLPIYKSL